MNSLSVVKVLEFEDFFPEENDFDIEKTLLLHNRTDLMRAASIMSCNYGDAWFNDFHKPFFSYPDSPYADDIAYRWNLLCSKNGWNLNTKTPFFTFRTAMELLRILFSLPENQFLGVQNKWKAEYDLFKCILAINTRIMACDMDGATTMAEMMYFNMYITNEMSNFDITISIRTQMTYANRVFNVLSSNKKCETLYHKFLERWQINNWREYTNSVNSIVCQMYLAQQKNAKGTPILDTEIIAADEGILNKDLIDLMSRDVADDISYNDNEDYKRFREKPLLRIGYHKYIPFSVQLLLEKMYGSVYFDLMDLYPEAKVDNLSFVEFYKKYLFEKNVFQSEMLDAVSPDYLIYPTRESILSENLTDENESQPDFYIHEGRHVIIFECKAVKLKGNLREKAMFRDLKHDLRVKFYNKKENADGTSTKIKPVGITQLTRFIAKAENGDYYWDKPNDVIYYPVLILEEPKIIKEGLACIMNRWYCESLNNKCDLEKYRPLIVMSVDTLTLYADYFREKGFVYYFEKFYQENVLVKSMADWRVSDFADFNAFIRQNCKGEINFDIANFIRG